jgi:hypothetical protein
MTFGTTMGAIRKLVQDIVLSVKAYLLSLQVPACLFTFEDTCKTQCDALIRHVLDKVEAIQVGVANMSKILQVSGCRSVEQFEVCGL